jgi:ClpP class serine protease
VTPTSGLTPEEQDIYKKLQDKVNRSTESKVTEEKKMTLEQQMTSWYKENMAALRTVIS